MHNIKVSMIEFGIQDIYKQHLQFNHINKLYYKSKVWPTY